MTTVHYMADEPSIIRACEKATAYLLSCQQYTGAWPGATDLGPQTTAEVLLALATLDALEPDLTARALAYFAAQQLADGSFPPYPGADSGTLEQTSVVYASLMASGVSPSHPMAQRAWASIRANGGFEQCPLMAQIWLVVAGVMPASQLPEYPVGWVLVPGIERQLGRLFAPAFTLMVMFLPALVRALRNKHNRPPTGIANIRQRAEEQRIVRYLSRRQNPTGNWFGAANFTALILICLRAFGVATDDPRIQRGIRDLKLAHVVRGPTLRFVPFDAQVWNTAITTTALTTSGFAGETPAIAAALQYLLRRQSNWPLPRDWQLPAPAVPRFGGWPFGDANPLACDCDTTGKVLHALSFHRALDPAIDSAIKTGLAWLWGMQHRNGGWGAFRREGADKQPGPFALSAFTPPATAREFFQLIASPPIQLDDPATADVTGRVLQALGGLGYRTSNPRIARAIAFLRRQRYHRGLWWGRWETNFLPSSAEVLSGLAAVGVRTTDTIIIDAVTSIFNCQNLDGGWGESVESYENLALAGCGESSTYVTGIVVRALVDLGFHHSPAVKRAIDYLTMQQNSDGSWPVGNYLFTLQWPWPFYRLELTSEQYALIALARYRRMVSA